MTAIAPVRGVHTVLVIGKENVGKSQLVSSLVGVPAGASNFRGSTVAVERYRTAERDFVDTPGVLRHSDTVTTRLTLEALEAHETVLLVVQAQQIDDDMADLLPLVRGKRGVVAVTFWDVVAKQPAAQLAIDRLAAEAGVPFVCVDARHLGAAERLALLTSLESPGTFATEQLSNRAGWRVEPRPGWLEHAVLGPWLATLLLLLPALLTIYGANRLANVVHPGVEAVMEPLVAWVRTAAPAAIRWMLVAEHDGFGYGLLNMGPFLIVWALPTVLLFSVILGVYKSSGLVERLNAALHPWVRPLGLSGRDLVRIVMGFGCNVPAVVSTRACSRCSRGPAISAIAFGAACSYQMPASLAVLNAVAVSNGLNPVMLTLAFLGYLFITTVLYLWWTAPRQATSSLNVLVTPRRPWMQWPSWGSVYREARGTVVQFVFQALPIFVVICLVASLLTQSGVLPWLAMGLEPLMAAVRLPGETALPVVLASIRKDGIFLLAADPTSAEPLNSVQVLTAVYLAGVLLPCLVTAWTIAWETFWRFAGGLLLRQAGFALAFSLLLAWGGAWLLP